MSDRLRRGILEIPGAEGFWKSRAELEYLNAAAKLSSLGWSDNDVIEFLSALYWTAAECYGGC